jgi:hypothetical protein
LKGSTLSMLMFYINRGGNNLGTARRLWSLVRSLTAVAALRSSFDSSNTARERPPTSSRLPMRHVLFVVALSGLPLVAMKHLDAQNPESRVTTVEASPSFAAQPESLARERSARVLAEYAIRLTSLGGGERSGRSVRRGAWIGAGVGFAAGLYGGFRLADGFGCATRFGGPPCHAERQAFTAILVVTTVGTGAGAALGALTGKLVEVLTPGPSTSR